MRKRFKGIIVRVSAFMLVLVMTMTEALAVNKEVKVFGAKSINDMGGSDHRVTMDELYDDYSDFVQVDTLREYFHKDQPSPAKADLGTELSWLIDNNIISRDSVIIVSNVGDNTIPEVNIEKMDISQINVQSVTRTDLIMHLYKAVFGPINARSIGVETANVRVDDGEYITLEDLMKKSGFSEGVSTPVVPPYDITTEGASGGAGGSGGAGAVSGQGGEGGEGGKTSTGGNMTQQANNDSSNWRYQPQGDLWESIFGDTNIFISQNEFTQTQTGGTGGNGGGGGNGGEGGDADKGGDGGDGGDASGGGIDDDGNTIEGTPGGDGGDGGDSLGGGGGGGGSGGTGGQAVTGPNQIDYETDYKQIYFIPGADILFYNTNDVPEPYIREALAKGLLTGDKELRTEEFNKTFIDFYSNDNTIRASWEGSVPAYVVNRSINKLKTYANVDNVAMQFVLGSCWNVSYSNGTMTIERLNPFEAKSGYFSSEYVTKMEMYRYIYEFLYANEKVLSDLERDIVNYKYGTQLEGIVNGEDAEIIEYLIAKGIINYDISTEFMNLGNPVHWCDLISMLYRLANKNARYDFSVIQLTDSEAAWKARGFGPRTLTAVPSSSTGTIRLADENAPDFNGDNVLISEEVGESFEAVATSKVDDGYNFVNFGDPTDNTIATASTSDMYSYRYTFTTTGLALTLNDATSTLSSVLNREVDYNAIGLAGQPQTAAGRYVAVMLYDMFTNKSGYTKKNGYNSTDAYQADVLDWPTTCTGDDPAGRILADVLCNMWVIGTWQKNPQDRSRNEVAHILTDVMAYMKEKEEKHKANPDNPLYPARTAEENLAYNALISLDQRYHESYKEDSGPQNISFVFLNKGAADGATKFQKLTTPGAYSQSFGDCFNGLAGCTYNIKVDGVTKNYVAQFASLPSVNTQRVVNGDPLILEIAGNCQLNVVTATEDNDLAKAVKAAGNSSGSLGAFDAASMTVGITTQVSNSGSEGFVSRSQIEQYNTSCTNQDDMLPLTFISDFIILNTQTNTRAYFYNDNTDANKSIALVGNEVVTGDSQLGVVFRSGEGESADIYYHINAIRLLVDSKQEASILGGVCPLPLADVVVTENLKEVVVDNGSGTNTITVPGLWVLMSKDDETTSKSLPTDSVYFSSPAFYNMRWGEFIGLSQSNRMANAVARQYTYEYNGATQAVYMVLMFEPLSVQAMGSETVTSEMSMEDLLDGITQPPADSVAKQIWTTNKERANAFANWIYQTTGVNYVNTGYLEPHAYIYSTDGQASSHVPASFWSALDAVAGLRGNVTEVQLMNVSDGALAPPGSGKPTISNTSYISSPQHKANYLLSADYKVAVVGNRVYVNVGCFPNIEQGGSDSNFRYRTSGVGRNLATFTVGSVIKLDKIKGIVFDGVKVPKLTVTKTASDGTITCQFGPIVGPSFKVGSSTVVLRENVVDGEKTLTLNDAQSGAINRIRYIYEQVFRDSLGIPWENFSVAENPALDVDTTRTLVNTGAKTWVMNGNGNSKTGEVDTLKYDGESAIETELNAWVSANSGKLSREAASNTETFLTVKFSALEYRVENGTLIKGPSRVSDFVSPELFTSLNDLIIDKMISEDTGAIPLEEVPDGSLVLMGSDYYAASGGSAADKKFIGYSALNGTGTIEHSYATEQDAAKSFASHFIYVGNQPMNITHFFTEFWVITSFTEEQKTALQICADNLQSGLYSRKALGRLPGSVTTTIVDKGYGADTRFYAPVQIKVQPGTLLAYETSSPNDAVKKYEIIPTADSAMSGALDNLPFFNDSVLSGTARSVTTDVIQGGFKKYEGAKSILEDVETEYEYGFASDLFTLARMLVFIVLVWLVCASWLCFGCYYGGLMPVLESIRYPTNNREGKGIDLFKIVSLGSISMETDFKVGRFIQYNLVLAVLLVVVWLSGNITF